MNKQKLSILIVSLLFLAMLLIGIRRMHTRHVESVSVDISKKNELFFVREVDILKALRDYLGGPAEGLPIRALNLSEIETVISKNPWVRNAEVHVSYTGQLRIEIEPRVPLIRVTPESGKPYYLDIHSEQFPVSSRFSAHVPVATGKIDSAVSKKVYTLMRYVHESPFWKGQVQQIFVESENNLFIVPTVGNHIIEIGDVSDLDEKFENLLAFYKEILPKAGWNKYREVSIRYKGQVIGRKP